MSNSYEETFIFTEGGEQTIAAGSFTPKAVGIRLYQTSIRNLVVSRLFSNMLEVLSGNDLHRNDILLISLIDKLL